jgi:hypothetical protein
MYGICYECKTCLDFDFCYKCYLSRRLTHPDHPFKTIGPEYEPVNEEAPAEEEGNESEDGDDDDDDDDTDDNGEGDEDDDGKGDEDDDDEDDDAGSKHGAKQVDAEVAGEAEEVSTDDDDEEQDI